MKKTLLLIFAGLLFFAGTAFSQSTPVTGEFEAITDASDGGSSTVKMEETTRDGMKAWRFTGEVTTQFQYGFAGWELKPDAASLTRMRALRNTSTVSFKVLGDGKRYTVKFRMPQRIITDWAHHEFHFNTRAGEVQEVTVQIRQFQQPAWSSSPVNMQIRQVDDISWQTHESWRPGTFDITVWDIKITP